MAAVDSLLKIVVETKNTFGIKLVEGDVPCLLTVEGERALSMPPLNKILFQSFLEEILNKEDFDSLENAGSMQTSHEVPGLSSFRVKVKKDSDGFSAVFSRESSSGTNQKLKKTGQIVGSGGKTEVLFGKGGVEDREESVPAGQDLLSVCGGSALPDDSTEENAYRPDRDGGVVGRREETGWAEHAGEHHCLRGTRGDEWAMNEGLWVSREFGDSYTSFSPERLKMEGLLRHAVEMNATDIILAENEVPRMRINGRLNNLADEPVSREIIFGLLAPVMSAGHRGLLRRDGSVDLALEMDSATGDKPLRLRVSLFEHINGVTAAIRPVARVAPDFDNLGLPRNLSDLALYPHGLVLFTGPTGSGKSTTLAALLGHLNRTLSRYVITIEDPIEYRYAPGRCVFHQREVGRHVPSFALGLRAALRGSPDVILVGEMRDRETISAAITAAETGHLVLSTLHCGTSDMAVDRMVDVFDEFRHPQVRLQLADVLRAVVSQRLIPDKSGTRLVPAVELLVVTPAVSALIREGRTHQIKSYLQSGREAGMVSMEESLRRLVKAGRITRKTAEQHAPNRNSFEI